jgi:tRNA threonylcarbamoyladenosine biosynthesis protein TsaE
MAQAPGEPGPVKNLAVDDPESMEALGAALAVRATPGCRIYLSGDLGAGKTTLVRGFLRRLGAADRIKSPTYTLVEPYSVDGKLVYHLDLYRLRTPAELEAIGYREYLDGPAICLLEWPERGEPLVGSPDIQVRIHIRDGGRAVQLQAFSPSGTSILEGIGTATAADDPR